MRGGKPCVREKGKSWGKIVKCAMEGDIIKVAALEAEQLMQRCK